jgi:hypothetical protein
MNQAVQPKRKTHWTLIVGLCIWAIAIFWWLTYYGQWKGTDFINRKLGCLMGDAHQCAGFRDFINQTGGTFPVYPSPIWYLGLLFVAIGLFMSMRKKA